MLRLMGFRPFDLVLGLRVLGFGFSMFQKSRSIKIDFKSLRGTGTLNLIVPARWLAADHSWSSSSTRRDLKLNPIHHDLSACEWHALTPETKLD